MEGGVPKTKEDVEEEEAKGNGLPPPRDGLGQIKPVVLAGGALLPLVVGGVNNGLLGTLKSPVFRLV